MIKNKTYLWLCRRRLEQVAIIDCDETHGSFGCVGDYAEIGLYGRNGDVGNVHVEDCWMTGIISDIDSFKHQGARNSNILEDIGGISSIG